ncbi:MAG: hypothetical protein U0169_25145 [Polyangiaceae bacterium]
MVQDVQACGQGAFALVFLGIAGFVASFLAIILASIRAKAAAAASVGALVLGALTIVLAILSARRIDRMEDEAHVHEPVPTLAFPDRPTAAADVPRLDPAKGCVILGFQAGSMPLLAGTFALVWARMSRRKNAEPDLP